MMIFMGTPSKTELHPRLPSLILDAKTLSDTLSSPFVLLVGSAVSGVNSPHVPMALRIMKEILLRAARALEKGTYAEKLLAQYALSLCNGSRLPLLKTTKFEEFLWQIEIAAGRDALDELLAPIYVCDDGEYGPNQQAIGWLLHKRVCLACLTTNFDNSIELASPTLKVLHHPNYPKSLPSPNDSPVLLKLHGDAQRRNCVATSRAMSNAKRLASHGFLRDLLAGQTVLVLGYSGTGDVDISPHLASAGATYVWGVKDKGSLVPPFVKCRAICDLGAVHSEANLLLGLAELHGWQQQTTGQSHEWTQALDRWCHSLDSRILSRIVALTLFGQTGWAVAHISEVTSVRIVSDDPLVDEGIACLQISAYDSADRIFRRAISWGHLSHSQYITAMLYLGFTQWRRGDLEQALHVLWWFYDTSFESHTEEEYVEIGDGLRIYLEVARDWMQLRRGLSERQRFYRSRRLDDVINRLKSLPTVGFRGDILAKAIILHICYLVGEPVDTVEVKKLFDESLDTTNWTAAEAVARLLVCLSFWHGLSALVEVDGGLVRRGQWNTIRKSAAAILHALLGGRFPIILNVLDGPVFARMAVWWREWRYRKNLGLWNDWHRRGVTETI